ncbi:Hsp70 family protein [Nonomuraea endophytica]|uniref:Actin-like ATPase involved in cell morphogenesis n=1 Tax=Nonomuraea endophytica TaxID=714136 RepID=A0A7W8ADX4_9ACTN|nr:Hsp70 family protein [Nonomuraea endophytica]MBB5083286.1 actin-like ATPase involved in cell morphogenesis [Nonomuraea endophytica]
MGVVYGIDFGTSNSSIMVGLADGRVVVVPDPETRGAAEIPTAVLATRGKLYVGTAAKRLGPAYIQNYRTEFKRDFGDDAPVHLDGRRYQVHELVAEVLRHLRAQARRAVPGEPDAVVITVPVSWDAGNHDLMKQAAELAGFDPATVTLVSEPVAGVRGAVTGQRFFDEQTILLYDLGGGTFDCALTKGTTDAGFRDVGRPGGIPTLGGIDFDREILTAIRARHPEQVDALFADPEPDVPVLRRRLGLRDTCEKIKHALSQREEHRALLSELDPPVLFTMTRDELAELLDKPLAETMDECDRLLGDQELAWDEVTKVIPVGGSSRLPMVHAQISRRSGVTVLKVEEPELAVVRGAAHLAMEIRDAQAVMEEAPAPAPPVPPVPRVRVPKTRAVAAGQLVVLGFAWILSAVIYLAGARLSGGWQIVLLIVLFLLALVAALGLAVDALDRRDPEPGLLMASITAIGPVVAAIVAETRPAADANVVMVGGTFLAAASCWWGARFVRGGERFSMIAGGAFIAMGGGGYWLTEGSDAVGWVTVSSMVGLFIAIAGSGGDSHTSRGSS